MTPVLRTVLLLLLAWLAANVLHGLWIGVRRRFWEREIRRDAAGVAADEGAYTLGDGPVAVLWIHGFADTPRTFGRMAERLAASGGFTCRAMRLPGAAEPLAAAARQTQETWLAAVAQEAEALRRSHRQVWLLGHSLGGTLALAATLRDPALADGLILLAPLLEVSRRRSPVLPPRTWFRIARVALAGSPVFESCFRVNAVAADDPGFAYHRDRFIPFATYRSLFALLDELAPRAGDVRVPLFAALAAEDRVVDTPAAARWLERVASPKDVRVLPDRAHALPLEAGWQALTDEIGRFLRVGAPRLARAGRCVIMGAGENA
jgi:carboxylesterase